MQDEVGTLKEQLATLRKQMQSNDALLADMPLQEGGEGNGSDATKNGAAGGDDSHSDSESTATSSGDEADGVVTEQKNKQKTEKKN